MLCPVGFRATVAAVGPETAELVAASPELDEAAELPVPMGWEL